MPFPETGQTAYINLHWSAPGQNGRRFWDGRACENVDEFIKTLNWALTSDGNKDIYVCMSSQARMEEKTSKRGYNYKKALRSANDVVALKSLFIDVDVKEGAYEDTREALNALRNFISEAGLPTPSAVVASGSGGFHVHWALDRTLTRDEWQVLANALARAAQEHGLKCDSQCTIDAARILRVPETFNHKGDEPKPVRLLSLGSDVSYDEVVAALQPYTSALPRKVSAERIEANDELGANLETAKAPPIIIDEVAKSCQFIARTLGTGGKDNNNPLWFMTASVATFVEEGREAFHQMSCKHAGYDPVKTDELFDRTVANQKARNLGWPQCSKIAGYGAPECAGCPLLAKNKSPLNFALPTATYGEDTLPDRFVRNPNGTIGIRAVQEDGTQTILPLSRYPMWKGWLSPSPWTLHFTTMLSGGAVTQFELPTEVIGAKDGLSKFLCAKGLFCSDKESKLLKEFFMAWIQKLQQTKDKVIAASPFGWSVIDGKIDGFAYGGRVWGNKDDRPAANPDTVLSYQYGPRGDASVWNELARVVYSQNRPALNAILAVAFAGPLVRFTGHPGLLLNAYSTESGIGKTTTMKCSQAVWAHPVMAMQGLDDTGNSVLKKLGQIKSLPAYWDEIKSEDQVKNFCGIVFTLTGGREKTRMNTDTTLRESGSWQTILVSASNESLIDPLIKKTGSTTAGLYRMFEYQVPKPTSVGDVSTVQRLVGKLEDNYGHAGLIYAKFLGANFKRIEDEVGDLQAQLFGEVNASQDERLWIGTMTVVLKGAEYANQLGLTQINLDELKAFLIDTLEGMRAEIKKSPTDMNDEMSLSTILAQFINSTRQNTLITNRTWLARGKPPKGAIQVLNDSTRIQRLGVHLSTEDKLLRISSSFFSEWMAENGHSRKIFLDRMEREYGVEVKAGRLAGGTDLTSVLEHVIWVDMNHPKLKTLIE